KLHSLGPKNVRRTSEETPKKLWSRKGPDKTRTGRTKDGEEFAKGTIRVNIYDFQITVPTPEGVGANLYTYPP
ncbi:MAG: hypothetical protein K2I27_12335, partial [Bacteroides sp.]|nr:hypothetical protein [Bacteroides sp.]